MKIALSVLVLFLAFGLSRAEDTTEYAGRLKVALPSEEESQVEELLENIESSVNNNNYKGYTSCLTKELASRNKKKTILLFFNHKLSMNLEKFEIMESDDKSVEIMTKYNFSIDGDDKSIVSLIIAKKQKDNKLLLSSEEIISGDEDEENGSSVSCVGGNCKVAKKKTNMRSGDGDPNAMNSNRIVYFDENGNIDIRKLMQAFPEKYKPACNGGNCNR